jgi:hypothetical protein
VAVNLKGGIATLAVTFLSRLRGGEQSGARGRAGQCFLSRLRGGERCVRTVVRLYSFLSRLRGGELLSCASGFTRVFLSRLRGGELESTSKKSSCISSLGRDHRYTPPQNEKSNYLIYISIFKELIFWYFP